MKKIAALLVALMLVTSFAPAAAMALEPFAKPDAALEADRRRPSIRRDRDRRPPPPPVRRDRDRGRGNSIAGSLIGGAIGGLIAGAIMHSDPEPEVYYVQPAPPPVYVVPAPKTYRVCDEFGRCWYETR